MSKHAVLVVAACLPALALAQEPIDGVVTASALRGANGRHYRFECPAGVETGPVWGTDVYTDDSSICGAAVHAGQIDEGGGAVTIEIIPGEESYAGTRRHGLTTGAYGAFHGSFRFVDRDGAPVSAGSATIAWTTNAVGLRGRRGAPVVFTCPSGEVGSAWGTDVYTDDSSICTAAVHAGVIGPDGGRVEIEMLPGRSAYRGSARHGVTTSSYGAFDGSFRFAVGRSPALVTSDAEPADATTTARAHRGRVGAQVSYDCAPGAAPVNVWGTDVYTDDSSVCGAAQHAGALTRKGGRVTIEMGGPRDSFEGSSRWGVTSQPYGSWGSSFTVLKPKKR